MVNVTLSKKVKLKQGFPICNSFFRIHNNGIILVKLHLDMTIRCENTKKK